MDNDNRNAKSNRRINHEIRIKSYIDCDWSEWFDGLTITQEEDGTTLLAGPIPDQAALYGLLKRINDLGLPLVSVNQVEMN